MPQPPNPDTDEAVRLVFEHLYDYGRHGEPHHLKAAANLLNGLSRSLDPANRPAPDVVMGVGNEGSRAPTRCNHRGPHYARCALEPHHMGDHQSRIPSVHDEHEWVGIRWERDYGYGEASLQ